MSKKIFEELGGTHRGHAAGNTDAEKQASQLASDVKYKVKRGMNKATKLNPAQVSKAYLAQLAKSPAPPAVKALAKKKLVGEEYTVDIKDLVEKSLVSAMVEVFTEATDEEKVWVVVTDKKTGNTYRRRATRAKVAELRSNPNIARVEITAYHPNEKDDEKGQKTAKVKSGKGLDPVGREDKDIDNDGDHDKSDKYLLNRRKVRGAAIAKKKGVAEEFIGEVKEDSKSDKKKITGEKVNNYSGKNAVVKIFPSLGEQIEDEKTTASPQQKKPAGLDPNQKRQISTLQQFQNKERQLNQQKLAAQKAGRVPVGSLQTNSYDPQGEDVQEVAPPSAKAERMVKHIKKSYEKDGKLTKKEKSIAYATAWKHYNEEKECECDDKPNLKTGNNTEDPRAIPTKVNLVRNKLRAMGLKMSYEPEGEIIDEKTRYAKETGINFRKQKPQPKGGSAKNDKAFQMVSKMMGSGRAGVQPRGKKKEPGKKPPKAGEYGGPASPAQKVAKRRADAQRAQDNMSSRFD